MLHGRPANSSPISAYNLTTMILFSEKINKNRRKDGIILLYATNRNDHALDKGKDRLAGLYF